MNVTNYNIYRDNTVSGVIKTNNIDTGEIVAVLCYEYLCKEKIVCILCVTVKDKENKNAILFDLSKCILDVENDVIKQGYTIKSIEELLLHGSDARTDDGYSDMHLFMRHVRSEVTCKDEENMEFHKD